jgi:hypothetical protein
MDNWEKVLVQAYQNQYALPRFTRQKGPMQIVSLVVPSCDCWFELLLWWLIRIWLSPQVKAKWANLILARHTDAVGLFENGTIILTITLPYITNHDHLFFRTKRRIDTSYKKSWSDWIHIRHSISFADRTLLIFDWSERQKNLSHKACESRIWVIRQMWEAV